MAEPLFRTGTAFLAGGRSAGTIRSGKSFLARRRRLGH
ncbi:hypothetical protein CLOLEP_03919 [[Clostridium] leptum DSM 753]|uniref:Uncharacterized protein n=1 Tax=[Clostridium] leptum DSM 753 TaxID=428125 RepID=A7VZ90_9FIRM|nr:hypothetical protein CLOLEP_03919 [[Clostridium] leptum DSM 753]